MLEPTHAELLHNLYEFQIMKFKEKSDLNQFVFLHHYLMFQKYPVQLVS